MHNVVRAWCEVADAADLATRTHGFPHLPPQITLTQGSYTHRVPHFHTCRRSATDHTSAVRKLVADDISWHHAGVKALQSAVLVVELQVWVPHSHAAGGVLVSGQCRTNYTGGAE